LQRPSGYAQRHASMTRIDLLRRLGQHDAALVTADRVIRAAVAAGDVLLQHVAGLVKTELFVHTHKLDEAQTNLSTVIDTISQQQPTVYAKYQSVLSELLRYNRAILSATAHTERARRFYKTLGDQIGLLALNEADNSTEARRTITSDACSNVAADILEGTA